MESRVSLGACSDFDGGDAEALGPAAVRRGDGADEKDERVGSGGLDAVLLERRRAYTESRPRG